MAAASLRGTPFADDKVRWVSSRDEHSGRSGDRTLKILSNHHIDAALLLSKELMALSEDGEADASDDGCRLLYGIMRDCAYRIRAAAEKERDAHRTLGIWKQGSAKEGLGEEDGGRKQTGRKGNGKKLTGGQASGERVSERRDAAS